MIEHKPWHGDNYELGIGGQKYAIAMFSHHRQKDESDDENFTIDAIQCVIDGQNFPNLPNIQKYFEFKNSEEFWSRVVFFNFLPNCVGVTEERYADGSPEQISRGRDRVVEIMRKFSPDKMVIFTKKGWRNFPKTIEEQERLPMRTFKPEIPGVCWGTYDVGGKIIQAFGLRHPQYARFDAMNRAVSRIRLLPPQLGA